MEKLKMDLRTEIKEMRDVKEMMKDEMDMNKCLTKEVEAGKDSHVPH